MWKNNIELTFHHDFLGRYAIALVSRKTWLPLNCFDVITSFFLKPLFVINFVKTVSRGRSVCRMWQVWQGEYQVSFFVESRPSKVAVALWNGTTVDMTRNYEIWFLKWKFRNFFLNRSLVLLLSCILFCARNILCRTFPVYDNWPDILLYAPNPIISLTLLSWLWPFPLSFMLVFTRNVMRKIFAMYRNIHSLFFTHQSKSPQSLRLADSNPFYPQSCHSSLAKYFVIRVR